MSHFPETANHLDRVLSLLRGSAAPVAIAPRTRGGLIIVNRHYSDLISPGSRLILPRHFHCEAIYAIGRVQLCTVHSPSARQKSLRNRITGISLLERILQDFDDSHRALLLVTLLCHRLSLAVVQQSNLLLLGHLVRVLPDHMLEAIRRYEQHLGCLGQTHRLGNPHHLTWQRQRLPLPEPWLDAADLQPLRGEDGREHQGLGEPAASVSIS